MRRKTEKENKFKSRIEKQIAENKKHIKELMKQIKRSLKDIKKVLEKEDIENIMDMHSSAEHILLDAKDIAELISEIWILKMILEDKYWKKF